MSERIPFLDLKAQYATIREDVEAAIGRVVERQAFILGSEVSALEEELASLCNVRHAIGCASGSDALLIALMAIGLEPGDEVIVPTYTFFATAGAVARLGGVPVFADVDDATLNLDPEATAAAAERCTRLKAILPVHLFGRVADMPALGELGEQYGVHVIEDAAQAIGAVDAQGAAVGSIGTMGCFSFFPSKNLGCFGDGGLLTSSDDELAHVARILRVHGSEKKYHYQRLGLNSRLDALQAAILRAKVGHLAAWNSARRERAGTYDRLFEAAGAASGVGSFDLAIPLRTPVREAAPQSHVYHQYAIRVPAERRDGLAAHLSSTSIDCGVYYPLSLHLQECFAALGYVEGDCPNAERASKETLSLPIYPELAEGQIERVVETVVQYLRQ